MSVVEREPNKVPISRVAVIGAAVLVVLTIFAAVKLIDTSNSETEKLAESSETSSNPVSKLSPPPSTSLTSVDPIEQENRALATASVQSLKTQAQAVLDALGILEKNISRWNSEIEPLLTNDDGRWIASDPALVNLFKQLYDDEGLMTSVMTQSSRAKVNAILVPVQTALNDPSELYTPAPEMINTLTQEHKTVYAATKKSQESIQKILAMVLSQKKDGTKSDITLEMAIALQEADLLRSEAELALEAQKRLRDEKLSRIMEAQRKEAMAEAELAENKASLKMQQLEAESVQIKRIKAMADALTANPELRKMVDRKFPVEKAYQVYQTKSPSTYFRPRNAPFWESVTLKKFKKDFEVATFEASGERIRDMHPHTVWKEIVTYYPSFFGYGPEELRKWEVPIEPLIE